MNMRTLAALVAISTVVLLACNGDDGGTSLTPTSSPAQTSTPTASASPTPTAATATPEPSVCLQAEQFIERGMLHLDPAAGSESYRVAELRWAAHDGCERFVIELQNASGSADQRTGAVLVDFRRELGIVRIQLASATEVLPEATDAEFPGELAARAFVVRATDGSLYVDLHLREAAQAAAFLLESPARVVVDLRPGGAELPEPAAIDGLTVVLEPRSGGSSYPLRVAGYARHFEANVVVRMVQDGVTAFERSISSTDWTEAWGEFALNLDNGPRGNVSLEVGDYSARDGKWEGVAIELTLP